MMLPVPLVGPYFPTVGTAVGTITAPNATGNFAITGLGFRPSVVLALGTQQTAAGNAVDMRMDFGAAVSSSERATACCYARDNVADEESSHCFKSNYMMSAPTGGGSDAANDLFDLVSMDSAGFTITLPSNINGQIFPYLALGGINAKIGTFDVNTSTGNQSVTGTGFTPKLVLLFTSTGNTTEGGAANAFFSFGGMDNAGNQSSIAIQATDTLATSDCNRRSSNTQAFIQITPTLVVALTYVSMDSNGFTVNVATAPAAAVRVGYIALGGDRLSAKVSSLTVPSSTQSSAYTGVGFRPTAVILFGGNENALGAAANITNFVSFANASSQAYVNPTGQDNQATMNNNRRLSTTNCAGSEDNVGTTLQYEGALTSLDSDGFTINWTTITAGVTRAILYIAMRVA